MLKVFIFYPSLTGTKLESLAKNYILGKVNIDPTIFLSVMCAFYFVLNEVSGYQVNCSLSFMRFVFRASLIQNSTQIVKMKISWKKFIFYVLLTKPISLVRIA